AVPAHVVAPEAAARQRRMGLTKSDHAFEESKDLPVLLQQVPVQPGGFIILIPRIVVATLRVHKLVAGAEHGSSVGKHQDREEILDLLLTQVHYFRGDLLIAVPSTVPAQIIVGSIIVVFTVGGVALGIVSDQIVEAKTIVGSHVVNRLAGAVSIVEVIGKQISTAINPAHEIPDLARVAFNERAQVVSESVVPL